MNQGLLELGQERFGGIRVAFAVPARCASGFDHGFGVEAEAWIELHPSRI